MNSGKKVIKGEQKTPKEININATVETGMSGKMKALIAVGVSLAVLMVAYIVWENHHPKYLVSINGEKMMIEDMMYDIQSAEDAYAYMGSFYQQFGYANYWMAEVGENGETLQDLAKEECMKNFIEGNLLYMEAVENGYEINENDKKEAEEAFEYLVEVTQTTEDATEETDSEDVEAKEEPTEILGFTTEELKTILAERAVARRYKEDLTATYGITEKDVMDGIDKKKFRQYDIEYFSITLDGEEEEDGGIVEVTGEEKEARYKKMEALLKETDKEDWSKVLNTEETEEESTEVMPTYDTDAFIKSESYFDEEVTKMITSMKNGEVSDIVESDGEYFIIRMVNNNSTERYETEIQDAMDELKEERFEEDYNAMYEKYDVEIYEGDWNKVQMGSIAS